MCNPFRKSSCMEIENVVLSLGRIFATPFSIIPFLTLSTKLHLLLKKTQIKNLFPKRFELEKKVRYVRKYFASVIQHGGHHVIVH